MIVGPPSTGPERAYMLAGRTLVEIVGDVRSRETAGLDSARAEVAAWMAVAASR